MSIESIGQSFIWSMYFEQPLLNASKEYYSSQFQLFESATASEYLKKIDELFELEQERFNDLISMSMDKVCF